MKNFKLISRKNSVIYSFLAIFASVILKAQEKTADLKVDVNVNKGKGILDADWMSNPLVWVIAALVLIIIIAMVARGGGNKN